MERTSPGLEPESQAVRDANTSSEYPLPDADHPLWRQFAEAVSPHAFCQNWLALQCRLINGVSCGAVLLGPPDTGPFTPMASWPKEGANIRLLAEAAERVLTERHGLILKQDSMDASGRPSPERYHLAYPIQVEGRLHGVVALELPTCSQATLQATMRQLQWGSAWLELLVRRDVATQDVVARRRLQTVLDLTAVALGQERFYATAAALATALATSLQCDRVTVGMIKRKHVRVQAVSHSAHFEKQTNLIRLIESAMDEVLDQHAMVVYPSPTDGPTRITRAHEILAREHDLGGICSVPMHDGDRIVGVLTLERPTDRPFDRSSVELCEAIAAVAGPILEARRREDRWLPAKAAQSCRQQLAHLVGPHHVPFKLTVAVLAGLVLFFCFAKGDYRVSAKTVLEGAIVRAAVAPFNGYIADGPVRAGDIVQLGQVLCTLDDRELRLERLKWLSQSQQLLKQYDQAMAKREAAQVEILTAQLNQAKAELALIEDHLSRTQVLAPLDGVVIKGDLSQSLGAPVERGQVLYEIAPLEAYRVVVQVDERDIEEVAIEQQGHLVLSSMPTELLPMTVEKLTPMSEAREGRNYFRVEAQLRHTPEWLRPGMEGVGKIEIGRRLLIWIWTHQAIDWIRLALWKWLP